MENQIIKVGDTFRNIEAQKNNANKTKDKVISELFKKFNCYISADYEGWIKTLFRAVDSNNQRYIDSIKKGETELNTENLHRFFVDNYTLLVISELLIDLRDNLNTLKESDFRSKLAENGVLI